MDHEIELIPQLSLNLLSLGGHTPGGGDSHMKGAGMLVVSLRGVNLT